MNKCLIFLKGYAAIILLTGSIFSACQNTINKDSDASRDGEAPVYSPQESMERMKLVSGFEVKLVAAEPLVIAPVALQFDTRNRLWVVEMTSYMPDTLGTGEDLPQGRIVILSDTTGDGIMDTRKVFMDSLVMPRAICFINNGLLIAEPPNLWFVEIQDDRPVNKTLVDPEYAVGGNVEHQPNTLYRAMDNWIYNGESTRRYRFRNGQWIIEKTLLRGQWGISQDDQGRLFYNNNSQNLLGDFFPPAFSGGTHSIAKLHGYNERIVPDNRVYPAAPTPGVNRGYQENILDDSLRLINFTAASGPVIYRGDLFDSAFSGNAFVAEPSANLIKRNILTENGNRVEGRQAYQGYEFLASTDERFRPVTLYNSPEGALYLTDMYRGIIQHVTYLTPYLKEQIAQRKLSAPLNCGRIYKIIPQNTTPQLPIMPDATDSLVLMLAHPNGWIRDKAQQLLIDRRDLRALPALHELISTSSNPLAIIHALWTLEGLDQLQKDKLLPLLYHSDIRIQRQVLTILASSGKHFAAQKIVNALENFIPRSDKLLYPYIAFATKVYSGENTALSQKIFQKILKQSPEDIFLASAILDNYKGSGEALLSSLGLSRTDTTSSFVRELNRQELQQTKKINAEKQKEVQNMFPRGYELYTTICQSCHGVDGNGIAAVAPPLNNSEWVTGNPSALMSITLFGLKGPVTVAGKTYNEQQFGEMPGIGNNQQLSDEDIAELLSFIRKAWQNSSPSIEPEAVRKIRNKFSGRLHPFTQEELLKEFSSK